MFPVSRCRKFRLLIVLCHVVRDTWVLWSSKWSGLTWQGVMQGHDELSWPHICHNTQRISQLKPGIMGSAVFGVFFRQMKKTITHLFLDPFVYCDSFSCYRDWSNPIYFWTIRRWFVKNGLIKSLTILSWFIINILEHFVTNWHQDDFLTHWLCSLAEESHVTELTDAAVMITMMMMTTAASNEDQSDNDDDEMIMMQVSRWWLVWQSDDNDRGERRGKMQQVLQALITASLKKELWVVTNSIKPLSLPIFMQQQLEIRHIQYIYVQCVQYFFWQTGEMGSDVGGGTSVTTVTRSRNTNMWRVTRWVRQRY